MGNSFLKKCPVCGCENECFDDETKQQIIAEILENDPLKVLKKEYYKIVDSCTSCGYASYDFSCGITEQNKAIYNLNFVKFRMINNPPLNSGFKRSNLVTATESYALIREFKNQPKKAAYAYKLAAELLENEANNFLNENTVYNVVDNEKLEVYKKQIQHAYMLKRLSLSFNQKALEGGDMMCLFVMIDTLIELHDFAESKHLIEQCLKLNPADKAQYQHIIDLLIEKHEAELKKEEDNSIKH